MYIRKLPIKWQIHEQIVYMAIQQNGLVLEYAPTEMKNDKDYAIAALEQNRKAW